MDSNILNILKNLSEKMHCPGCGKKYTLTEVKFMGQQNGQFLIQLACESCKMPVFVNVIDGQLGKIQPQSDMTEFDSISVDEIIEFHEELKTFNGDFKAVFNR